MSLSVSNRRAVQAPSSLGIQQHSRGRPEQSLLGIQKRRSFIAAGNVDLLGGRRDYMRRGISVGRSFEINRQNPALISERRKHMGSDLQRQLSIEQATSNSKSKQAPLKSKFFGSASRPSGQIIGLDPSRKSNIGKTIAWSSTSSLLKSSDEQISHEELVLDKKRNEVSSNTRSSYSRSSSQIKTANSTDDLRKTYSNQEYTSQVSKNDPYKFNLSIVLSQTIEAITENDIDSSSEGTEAVKQTSIKSNKNQVSAVDRRAQFQLKTNKNHILSSSPVASRYIEVENNLNVVPLTIQRRPPLIRAMSAPVRSLDDSTKNIIAANKRKSRRRKIGSPDKPDDWDEGQCDKNISLDCDNKGSNKKVLSRSRSAIVPDVVTLVSLVSSEGSDSEKDETETLSASSSVRRAPSLRKTGKSENDPPYLQFAAKEFPNIIRRGSIAPLAARIRANRPPTAPPVSIFMPEANNRDSSLVVSTTNESDTNFLESFTDRNKLVLHKKELCDMSNEKALAKEDEIPVYVKTIKERECWKLFKKMTTKGINVTYETILRGMLTPTEFRQFQKQRELQEARARKAEMEKEAEEAEKKRTPTAIAVERLTEVLSKK